MFILLLVSPSKIASFFYHECERFLYYHSLSKKDKLELDIPKEIIENHNANTAIMAGGIVWEEKVVTDYLADNVVIGAGDMPLSNRYIKFDALLQELKNPSKQYIYQPTFSIPDRFYQKYKIDREKITFTDCRPDLIECFPGESGIQFRIIDVKSSEVLKVSHRVQTALYAMILQSILEEHQIMGEILIEETGIWLYEQEKPQFLSVQHLIPYLEDFLVGKLNELPEKQLEEVFWHLDYRCEWCSLFDYCLEKAKEQQHVSLFPYLSSQGSRFIRENGLPLTIEEFADYVTDQDQLKTLEKSASLRGRVLRIDKQLDSLKNREVIPYESFATDMPIGENIRLILTVQRDQVSGRVYAASIYRISGSELFGSKSEKYHYIAESSDQESLIVCQFVDQLYNILETVHSYNMERDWKEQKSVQSYVTDNYEWNNVQEILNVLLEDPEYQEKALHLMFYFHSDLLSETDEHPEDMIPFPIIVLTTVVSRLFALPAHIAYRLEDLSEYIASQSDWPFEYKSKEYLSFKLTNVMKSDIIHEVWNDKVTEKLEWIKSELDRRLNLANSVVSGIRAAAKDLSGRSLLFAWPEKFKLPTVRHYKHAVLSKLAFATRYETLLSYLEIRSARALSLKEKEEAGTTLHLTYVDDGLFRLHNSQVAAELETRDAWIITEKNAAGELEQLKFNDYRYRNVMYPPKKANLYYTKIKDIVHENGQVFLKLEMPRKETKFDFYQGEHYLVSKRYTDWTSKRVLGALDTIDEEDHRVLGLFDHPAEMSKKLMKKWDDEEVKQLVNQAGLTKSQRKAFRHFLNKTLTLCWGPPGTGKTHFIATSVLLLSQIYQKRRPLRILVSGFTHAAIENVLVKIQQLHKKEKIKVGKLNQVTTAKARNIEMVYEKGVQDWLEDNCTTILGATLYNIQKTYDNGWNELDFDIVILDEASQVRTADSLLALSHLKAAGRMLIVGDHFQLPPIVKGNYLVKENEPNVYDSIFKLLFELDVDQKYTCQLTENFRMNEVLCRYPASMIYGPNYTAFNASIANQKIQLANQPSLDWVETIANPDYPLVVCVYDGIQESQANAMEAGWVAQLSKEFRYSLIDEHGNPYEDSGSGDREFWQKGLFIISPHHAQIREINRQLEEQGLRPEFFVGTVDKMQGQESDVAIISYGVADLEQAVMEGEFIYSLNRLNVSITRGRSKTIVFLSRQLLSPALEIITNDELSEGVHFMRQLEKYSQENGETVEYQFGEVGLKVYRVMGN
ncbi:bifunctional RecB family nuclease/DEAD/DEAH box helicase [Neobacillus dielmonensis]|uniref:bifunctional RecB family nuclease/DEAD/DEAH box helicase n=1 Tax=Neobacillus dielmonensis TaxID=1347369 RepID=UPI0012B5F355|nr:AAA domain-containing protein [Neobacillus dielmonensis]